LAKSVHGVHFDDFSAALFERLVFAYHLRKHPGQTFEWYGEVGADLGRDIWGVLDDDRRPATVCVQCANRKRLSFAKVSGDIDKILSSPRGKPDKFVLVASCAVTASLRDKVHKYTSGRKVKQCEVWSGREFEERLRADCESLLRRFVDGEDFPDDPSALSRFAAQPGWAEIVREWEISADLQGWRIWASKAFDGIPDLALADLERLRDLCEWLLGRAWPSTCPGVRSALDNFRAVANDLVSFLDMHGDDDRPGPHARFRVIPDKAKLLRSWDPPQWKRLHAEWEAQCDVIRHLVLELTRAANLVCDSVREECDPAFRQKEGAAMVYITELVRPEYGPEERTKHPYPGLNRFKPRQRADAIYFRSR
jgi:hypothetical protein